MKKIFFIFLLVSLLSGCHSQNNMITKEIIIKDQTIKLEVAQTTQEQVKGLSGRESLCSNCGMAFVYSDQKIRHFWMNQMNFPIDIIWVKDGLAIGFIENVQPKDKNGEITRMVSNEPADLVLEFNAGFIKEKELKIGDSLKLD